MSRFKTVTEEEFDLFIGKYPNPLERHIVRICDVWCCGAEHASRKLPPILTYNDFSNGRTYPETSIIARIILNEEFKGYDAYDGERDEFQILE